MSEFKFACPVCGQHITTGSGSSGKEITCPTCFRKIVVPQAPASEDTKLILSAAQAAKPRPLPSGINAMPGVSSSPSTRSPLLAVVVLLLVLSTAGVGVWALRGKLFGREAPGPDRQAAATNQVPSAPARPDYPVPSNFKWTLSLTNAAIPDTVAAGKVHGSGFKCERATLQGGHLTLRQGASGMRELAVSVNFPVRLGEELSGRTIEVAPVPGSPAPRVTLRWKDEQEQPAKNDFNGGYALKATFGQATNGRVAGKLYLCLQDESKSFIAGTFDAELKKPAPPKQRRPVAKQ